MSLKISAIYRQKFSHVINLCDTLGNNLISKKNHPSSDILTLLNAVYTEMSAYKFYDIEFTCTCSLLNKKLLQSQDTLTA